MGVKLEKVADSNGNGLPDYQFYCPGCECYHGIWITNEPGHVIWKFNGDLEKPTFSPSLLIRYPYKGEMKICHTFIRDGKIQYLGDCTHKLKNQIIDMEDIENGIKT